MISVLNPNPAQRLLAITKRTHLDRFAAAHRVHIRKPHVLPLVAAFSPHPCMNKDHDAITGRDEPLRLTAYFCPRSPRLRQITLNTLVPVVSATTRKLSGLLPFDLLIEWFYCPIDIPPVKRRIRSTYSRNCCFSF